MTSRIIPQPLRICQLSTCLTETAQWHTMSRVHAQHPNLVQRSFLYEGVDETHLLASCLDFSATVCDYVGIDLPEGVEGRTVRPLLSGEGDVAWRDHALGEMHWESHSSDSGLL